MTTWKTIILFFVILVAIGGLLGYFFGLYWATKSQPSAPTERAEKEVVLPECKGAALKMEMRKLWEEHVAWTRMLVVSASGGLKDTDKVAARLLKNPADMEAALAPYYGEEVTGKLAELLTAHLNIAYELVVAARVGDNAKAVDAEKRWYDNADALAAALHLANPEYWPEDGLKSMLHEHLLLTKQEAVARLAGEFEADITAYDKIQDQALIMADALSGGVVKQFPAKF